MINASVRYDWKEMQPYIKKVKAADRKALIEVANYLIIKIQNIFPRRGSGRVYTWHGSKIRSSRPGKPPIVRSGRLKDSITANASWSKMGRITYSTAGGSAPHFMTDGVGRPSAIMGGNTIVVGSNVPYADDLEWGTWTLVSSRAGIWMPKNPSGSYIAPRPWLTPSWKKSRRYLFSTWYREMKRLL